MSVIKVKCSDQTLTATEAPLIAAGGTDENYIEFDFDGFWAGFAKIAVFYNKPNKKYATLIDGYGICAIPSEVTRTKGYMYFGVVATNSEGTIRTSEMLRYYIEEGAIEIEARPSNHTWEQILANMIKPIVGKEAPSEKELPSLWFNTGEVQGTKTDGYLTFVDNDGNKIVFYPNTRLENVDGAEDLLKTVAQQLTDAQKTQARGNIGAAASSHSHTKSEITDFPTSLPASDVSAWAKAATKPAYTADEVGAISQDNLQNAINEALAQAKASGEFDGTSVTHSWNGTVLSITSASGTSSADLKGADGYTPVKGTDYFTEADKTEMVNAVLAALPAAEGVNY